jgi:sigma-B regulation protein RsbQ
MNVVTRNNVTRAGAGKRVLMFAHGFGCDQSMWGRVAPSFAADHQLVLFDHVGAGGSDIEAYRPEKYGSLHGYAQDVIEICDALDLSDVTLVAHSVSATIAALAAVERPELFAGLVLICPSPRYSNTDTYTGGFRAEDVEELLDVMDINHTDWSVAMAPLVVGESAGPELQGEWRDSVCRTDPTIAKQFARVTFTSDHRADFRRVTTPALILESKADMLAPREVGAWVNAAIRGSRLLTLDATGHSPHITAPMDVIAAIDEFLGEPDRIQAAA